MRHILSLSVIVLAFSAGVLSVILYGTLADNLRPLSTRGIVSAPFAIAALLILAYACAYALRVHSHKRGIYPYVPSPSALRP